MSVLWINLTYAGGTMAKKQSNVRISITLGKKLLEYIDTLLATGLHGHTRVECVELLLCEAIGNHLPRVQRTAISRRDPP